MPGDPVRKSRTKARGCPVTSALFAPSFGAAAVLPASRRSAVARRGLNARRPPFLTAAERGDAVLVEPVGDGLERHAAGPHRGDSLLEIGYVVDRWPADPLTLRSGRLEPLAAALADALAFPRANRYQHVRDLLTGGHGGIDIHVHGHEPPAVSGDRLQDPAQVGR